MIDPVEAECLFPFTVDDREWDGCLVSGIQDFTHPTFKCPIRTIKNRNTSYFTNYNTANGQQYNELVNGVYCPTNSIGYDINFDVVIYTFNSDGPVFGPNGEYQLDPDNDQCVGGFGLIYGLPVFGTCKNSCRGGKLIISALNCNFIFYFQLISQLLLGDLPWWQPLARHKPQQDLWEFQHCQLSLLRVL